MGSVELLVLLFVVVAIFFLVMLKRSRLALRYRDASENEGSWLNRRAAHYLRKRGLLEILILVAGAAVIVFVQFKWGIRLL
jgi:hypothetical protein